MQKLTEEQSQWVLAEIKKFYTIQYGESDTVAFMPDLQKVINQCTEKKFPEIHMRPAHAEDTEEIKVYQGWCDGGNTDCIILYSYEEYTHFNIEQFKDFASKINKIVEFLNENS